MHHFCRICQEKHARRTNYTTQKAIAIPIIFSDTATAFSLFSIFSFSLLSRIFTGFLSLPICDLCFRFRLIFQRSFLFHFPVVDFLFFGKMFFFRGFSFAVKISTPKIFSLGFPKICSDLMFIKRFSFELLLYGSLSQVFFPFGSLSS